MAAPPASSSGHPTRRSTSTGCRCPRRWTWPTCTALTFDDIVDYLDRLGKALDPDANKHVQVAHDAALATSGLTPSILRQNYRSLPIWFDPVFVREMVDATIGIDHLEGWVEQKLVDGRRQRIRAFGSRAVHIVAGNSPVLSGVSVIRNAVTRSDAIIKTPSNDPLTAVAIARTMCEMDPDHPLTKHLAVAYWKGGDADVEARLYRPEHVEKIVAWGGFASVTHVTRYLQPGLEMIALDPKRSASIIGPEAFESEATMADVARRLACDVGTQNQEGCACARVVYVLSGTDPEGLAKLDRLGELTYRAILDLPEEFSTKPLRFDDELRGYLDAQRIDDDWYRVIGGEDAEGAVVVSHLDEPVDYSPILSGRVCNLVPVDSIEPGDRGGERVHADGGHLPGVAEGGAAGPAPPVRRAAARVARLRVQRHARRTAGCHRAAAPHVQVDRRRGVRPRRGLPHVGPRLTPPPSDSA